MFLSAGHLSIQYGVNESIAKFFVDREPPKGNRYWKDKLLYMRFDPGYLFIPLAVDLALKLGIPKEDLLSEGYVTLMEDIGHLAAQHEFKEITGDEVFASLMQLAKNNYVNENFYNHITDYLKGGTNNPFTALRTSFPALHRGDSFLISFCKLDITEAQSIELVKHWFALISTLLALDDAEDITIDEKTGDENAFIQAGLNKAGVLAIKEMINNNLHLIAAINKSMAKGIDGRVVKIYEMQHIQRFLD
jgi:hypothetical protein